jgi:hypothetical protein
MNVLFVVGAAMVVAGAISAFSMVRARDFVSHSSPAAGAGADRTPTEDVVSAELGG